MNKFVIIRPERNCGICGYIWQTIRAMYHNPDKNYYIDFVNCIYKVDDENLWDVFFEQPHTKTPPSYNEVEKEVGIIFDQESEFVTSEIIPNTNEEIQRRRVMFSKIISKHIKLKEHTRRKIDDFCAMNFAGKRVLGVHFRGTDHPNKKRMCDYMEIIKKKLMDYDILFVCSDEWERFRLAEVVFSNKIVSWNSLRSKDSDTPLHSDPRDFRYSRNNSKEYQHKIAEDVIIEAYILSRTDHLLCCSGSNVNLFARAINPYLSSEEL